MKAVVVRKVNEQTSLKVEEVPIPSVGPDQVLIKNKVVGLNPTDWKHAQGFSQDGARLGCDGTGLVEKIGQNVKDITVGSRRGYFLRGGVTEDNAAFADFTVVDAELTFEIPDSVTFDQAATLPIPFFTAFSALYQRLQLPEPTKEGGRSGKDEGKWILIYSGGTAVGLYAIQLAKLSGLRVITTASLSRSDELKALGATTVIDYRAKDVVEQLKDATGDKIEYALDCFGDEGTRISYDAISDTNGGKVVSILFFDPTNYTRKNVSVESTIVYSALSYSTDDIHFGPFKIVPGPNDRAFLVELYKRYPQLLTTLGLKFSETREFDGLEKIEQALELLQSGKVNGTKLIVRV